MPVETVFRRPIGLALDAAGTLWVADRNNEVIQRFGLPGTLTAAAGAFRVTEEEGDDGEETGAPAPAPSLTEFYLRGPTPCPTHARAAAPRVRGQVGLADSVNLECRNIMGRVVYQNAFGAPRGQGHRQRVGSAVHLRTGLASAGPWKGSILRGHGPQGGKTGDSKIDPAAR